MSCLAIPSASLLLAWYDRHRRRLPWRAPPGAAPDPYQVWLSEVMLQQTTVTAAIPYFERFVRRFPNFADLASAALEDVLACWAGLGYYARARNLHAAARIIDRAEDFPRDVAGWRALPGVGEYTATAIAAIAFGVPGIAVDGNVERVAARLFAITAKLPGAKQAIQEAAASLGADPAAQARPSDFAQALFDLGATVCTPAAPGCVLCPWIAGCMGRRQGIAESLPAKAEKPDRPLRHGVHFWLTDASDRVLLRRRPASGLLGGMTELPGTAWRPEAWSAEEALQHAPMQAKWCLAGEVRHGFTHFALRVILFHAQVDRIEADGFLRPVAALDEEAMPSLMRKCVRLAPRGR